ncbi:MAG: response regulator [Chitinophagaceae bacterium]
MSHTVLVIDDERAIRASLSEILSFEGYKVEEASDGAEGLKKILANAYDCVICDIKMPKMDGLEVLEKVMAEKPDTQIIIISGHGNIETAVEAVKKGAFDYISKPPDLNRLLITLRNAMERKDLVVETKQLRKKVEQKIFGESDMIGNSEPLQKIRETLTKIAPTEARVLITGENGVGKELVARNLHKNSNRAKGPMIEVNCAAIPSELIESELFGHEKGLFHLRRKNAHRQIRAGKRRNAVPG